MRLRTQLLFGYATVLFFMILMAVVNYQCNRSLLKIQTLVEQAREIADAAQLFQKSMLDMQTAIRGYLIVGEEPYLYPYEEGRKAYERQMRELRSLLAHDRLQLARLQEIEVLVERWLATVALPEIEERDRVTRGEVGLAALAQRIGEEDKGRNVFQEIRDKTNALLDVEQQLLKKDKARAELAFQRTHYAVIGFHALATLLGIGAALSITRSVVRRVGGEPREIAAVTEQIARGNLDVEMEDGSGIRGSVSKMLAALRENRSRTLRQDWLQTGITQLNEVISGDPEIAELGAKVMAELCTYLDAQVGTFYVAQDDGRGALWMAGSYAHADGETELQTIQLGEGVVGQAAVSKQQRLIRDVPPEYLRISSSLGEHVPRCLCVTPFLYERRLKGVVEVGTFSEMTESQIEYLQQAMPILAIAVHSVQSRARLSHTLEESQRLTAELQTQQEELKVTNEELEHQAERLEESESRLKVQQEELELANRDLEETNELLERQKKEVEQGRQKLKAKAKELTLASKYKSEFLANMSHELRTPLNSLLLLSQDLASNRTGNLTEQQIESAQIIHSGGKDLLNLINDVLDLSKIEAGRMDVQVGRVLTHELADSIRASFEHVARDKQLSLEVVVTEAAPKKIASDRKRVEQILRNLVSNAIKFTEQGGVTVTFDRPAADQNLSQTGAQTDGCLAISVKDTGIGIESEQQKLIFEAFQQADSGTSRRYSGTGLGLSISRELVRLLCGELDVESKPGEGSTFTLLLPVKRPIGRASAQHKTVMERRPDFETQSRSPTSTSPRKMPAAIVEDDRDQLKEQEWVVLIIEDDTRFARLLRNKCHERNFKCLIAPNGEAGLELATERLPSAIILDVRLPGMDGWAVLNVLKEDTRTRHIPVHIVSVDEPSTDSLRKGAIGHAVKPLDQGRLDEVFRKLEEASDTTPKRVLVVEDNADLRRATVRLLAGGNVTTDEAETGAQALEALRTSDYHCVVLDLGLPDMDGDELLAALERQGVELPPVVVHTGRELTSEEERALREHAEAIVIKDVRSQERLLDEVSLFLHCIVSKMPEKTRKIICDLHDTDALLRGRKVLVVDDDMRTTFAMSHFLSTHGMETLKAENGQRALRLLNEHPDVDLVMMDIMMPVMDGYEAMKHIRTQDQFRKLPIIVLTAKAMPEDREKCLKAGANDYLPKPVDQQRLLSMLRVWLHR